MGDAQNSEKQRGKPFAKGDERINRGGRPKGYNAFRKKFRDRERNDAMRNDLYAIATSPTEKASDRLNAMRLYWEYGYGKAPAAPDDRKLEVTATLAATVEHDVKAEVIQSPDRQRSIVAVLERAGQLPAGTTAALDAVLQRDSNTETAAPVEEKEQS